MKRIVLLDVSAIMYRAFYANMNFRTKNEPTGAIYGFTNTLLSVIKEFSPDYIGAAQDVKRASLKRSEVYSEYKQNRDAMPEDLATQISRIEEVLDDFNIKKFKIEGYEADDVLGTVSKKFSKEGYEVFIITGDKDLAQLVDENINIALMGKGEDGGFKILSNDDDVIEHLGVKADLIPDLFGLIGDSSDGIPGVRKVGPKKAIPMLDAYKNLEGIYENVDKLKEISGIGPGLIKNIIEDKELAFLSRELATIEKNIPLELSIEDIKYEIKSKELLALFKELGFRALIKRMNLEEAVEVEAKEENVEEIEKEKKSSSQLGLFGGTVSEEKKEENLGKKEIIVDNKEKFESMISDLKLEDKIYFMYGDSGVAFTSSKNDFYIPLSHNLKLGEKYVNLDRELVDEIFKLDKKFVTYGFKKVLKNLYKLPLEKMDMDEMIAFHLITSQTKEGIEAIAMREGIDSVKSYYETYKKEIPENIGIENYGKFMIERAKLIKEVYPVLIEDLEERNLLEVIYKIEMPLIEVLNNMEENGIEIDPVYFAKYSEEITDIISKLENKIYEIAGEKFNLNSPKQLAEILFLKLNINAVKKTKTGYSTNVDVLEELVDKGHEIAKYILEYRKFAKLKSTYVDALPSVADKNNRIHTSFNQTGTATGRLSSSDPNLQNIPVKTDDGIKIREGFIASKGYKLLGIDYSQIELRVLAEMSGDKNLIKAYEEDKDLHSLTAKKIFNLHPLDDVSREERIAAKIINFSIIYGKTAFGLAQELKITRKEAEEYIERYFDEYPGVKRFEKTIIDFVSKNGYSETYFKRRREIEGINSKNKNIRNQADRMAINSVIQGTAAEILKQVMINVYKEIKDKDEIKMLLQVHDELIFQVKEEVVEEYKNKIVSIMENSISFSKVKLKVNSAIGDNWAETK